MNREDVIRMAREAGFEELFKDSHDWVCFTEEIERFAALVAKAAIQDDLLWQAETETAVLAEREACAKVVEVSDDLADWEIVCGSDGRVLLNTMAAAIRARGQI